MSSLVRMWKTVTSTQKPSLEEKKQSPVPPPTPISSLPDDLLLSIFARVSRLYYPTLSLVCKSFRSLIASPELYETRSFLGRTESCLYVCFVESHPDPNPLWFTLCRKPDRTLNKSTWKKKKKPSGNLLIPIPNFQPPLAHWSGHATLGSDIYYFGGYEDGSMRSSRVLILDCRSHTLREAPRMQVERYDPSASVIDGKIYVAGGGVEDDDSDSLYPIEVFDTKTQIWDHMPIPYWEENWGRLSRSTYVDEKFYLMIGSKLMAYDPEEGKWDLVQGDMGRLWPLVFGNCVIENVLYCHFGAFRWYDTKLGLWKTIKGLKGLPKIGYNFDVKMADYGGKMAVFWDKTSSGDKNKTVWFAVIALERPNSEEIWGKVEWHEAVLTIPVSYQLHRALALVVTV